MMSRRTLHGIVKDATKEPEEFMSAELMRQRYDVDQYAAMIGKNLANTAISNGSIVKICPAVEFALSATKNFPLDSSSS